MTEIFAITLAVLSTFMGATSFLLFKLASSEGLVKSLFNIKFSLGIFLAVLGAAIFAVALKYGELSFLFSLTALTYIWVALFAWKFLEEKVTRKKIIGIALIVFGIIFATL